MTLHKAIIVKYDVIHNSVSQCCQRRSKPWQRATYTHTQKNGHVVFELGLHERTDRQTDILITILHTAPTGEVTSARCRLFLPILL